MSKSNDTLKIPGQTRDKKRQENNGNSGIRVRIVIVLDHCTMYMDCFNLDSNLKHSKILSRNIFKHLENDD